MNEFSIELLQAYQSLNLSEVIDFDKFNHYSITHHSTSIEGSTLTATETRLLLDEELTPKGKPLLHSLMVKNHYDALRFVLDSAEKKQSISVKFIQEINAKVLKNTGSVYRTLWGDIDSTKGSFRKSNVSAGVRFFPNFPKVENLTKNLVEQLNDRIKLAETTESQLILSFDAHFELVSIHPFYDGNGRTSRLLMNYLQQFFGLPLGIVFSEDKTEYFDALEAARNNEDLSFFRDFMFGQYAKHLRAEMEKFNSK
jgi:Fic family protein